MIYKRFEKWDLDPIDFEVDVYTVEETSMRTSTGDEMTIDTRDGVTIELLPYDISVSCHSQNSQIKNRDECLNILETILTNYKLK